MQLGSELVVEPLTSAPDDRWDDAVSALGGYAFQSRGFGMACADLGEQPLFLVLRRDGRAVGYAIALRILTRVRPLGWARDTLELISPPVLERGVSRLDVVEALQAFAKNHRYGELRIGSLCDPHVEAPYPAATSRVRLLPRLDYRLPIGPDFSSTLSRMASTHRRKIRKVLSTAFTFEEQSDLDGARRMYAAHAQTFERRHSLGQTDAQAWPMEDFLRRMDAYLRHGIVRFHFAVGEGETLSAIGTMQFGRTAFYLIGGTTSAGFERSAAYAMFAETIQRLIREGISIFHLGGTGFDARDESSDEHGLYRFKTGYGGIVSDCAQVHVRLTPWRWWPGRQQAPAGMPPSRLDYRHATDRII